MCDFKVCRICLINESKFYRVHDYNLKTFYEELTDLRMTSKDSLPQYFCYECAALLYKFYRFRERCYDGQDVLLDVLRNGPITTTGISELNAKKLHKCQFGHLDILAINKRVRLCTTNHLESVKMENFTELKDEYVVDFDHSDITISDDDDFEHKDPETDPMPEEHSTNLLNLKYEIDVIYDDNKESLPNVINAPSYVEIKPEFKRTKCKDNNEATIKETEKKSPEVKKRTLKQRKCSRQTKEKNISKVKSKKKESFISPNTAKNYKFYESSTMKNLAFLDSGNWNKSRFTEEEALKNFEAKAQDKKYLNAPYKCTDCYRGFSQLSMLERHIPQRHSKAIGKEVCRFCKMRFKSKSFLNKHMKQHYTKYECLRCDIVCSFENSAAFHEEYHNGVVRKCPHCDKEFKHLSTFYTHLRTHRSKHICAICGESFVSELGLRMHGKSKHRRCDADPPLNDLDENMYCEICQMKFLTKDAYDKHLAHSVMHTDQNKEDEDVKNKDEGNESDEKKTEEPTKRRSRRAARKTNLPRGMLKKPTTCYHCGEHFESQSACMKHHLAMHPRTSFYSPKERIICEVCGTSLAPGSVASHLNQHTRAKMYTCDTCDRSFTTSTNLRIHLVTHTGEKRYACNLCDKRFTQQGSLNLHYKTFHLKQPYPKRNRSKKIDQASVDVFTGKEE